MAASLDPATVINCVKKIMISESQITLDVDDLPKSTPLNGELLQISSLSMLGMLLKLEDELGAILPDNMLVGQTFHTVDDVISAVLTAMELSS